MFMLLENEGNCTVKVFVVCTSCQILLEWSSDEGWLCRTCSTHKRKEIAYRVFVRKSKGGGPLERPRHRWEETVRMDIRNL
jgi:hypothetical protein